MDALAAIRVTFFQECEEQLAELETGLLAMQNGDADPETVNAVFRAVHSIKGGAGAFSLEELVRFAHVFETTLDEVRSGRLAPDADLLKVMLRAADVLADLVRASRDGGSVDEERSAGIAAELSQRTAGGAAAEDGAGGGELDSLVFTPVAFPGGFGGPIDIAPTAPASRRWTIRLRPHASLYAKANETALLLRELQRLGAMQVALDESELPLLPDLDPEGAFLAWTITLDTAVDEGAIREVFDFVDGDCELDVRPEGDRGAAQPIDISALLAPAEPTPPPADLDIMALIARAQAASEPLPAAPIIAEVSPESAAEKPPATAAAPRTVEQPAGGGGASIRVDLERVDRLIDLVGELVINQAMLAQRVVEGGLPRSSTIAMGLDELEQLTREIQDSVMAIRAQPVKSVFQRMPRLVREVAAATSKQVRLVTDGEGTEVDKTVIERLTDPITHMIRNAIDHGLEQPEDRLAAGKPAEGVVRLAALHRSGRIVIEVSDDGKGIDRKRVKSLAAERGLIAADAALSDDEVDNLIFMPGFSTAAAVSDISGRGVGMDVVKRSIQALGGRISIASRPGHGSTFTLSLPLTLAVLDGMVVSVAGQMLVVPLTAIIETLQPKANDIRRIGAGGTVVVIRDTYVPLVDVGLALGYRDVPLPPSEGVAVLVENEAGGRAAFLVEAIQGQRQVVIKSLESNYRKVTGIAAATILGDGRVALILDVDAVIACQRADARVDAPRPELLLATG